MGALLVALLVLQTLLSHALNRTRPNVVFVVIEDLRADGWYGGFGAPPVRAKHMELVAPNIHRLMRRGVAFDLAFAQVSVCAPSRASMLTGLRPDKLGIFDFSHYGGIRYFRTITSHLHRVGYQTSMAGKLHHWESHRYYSGNYWGEPDWDRVHKKVEKPWENSSVTPDAIHNDPLALFFRDSHIAKSAVASIRSMNNNTLGGPWFQGIGFKGTHMPYHMPKRFWDKLADVDFNADALEQAKGFLTFPPDAPLLGHVMHTEGVSIAFLSSNGSSRSTEREAYQHTVAGPRTGRTISRRGFQELYRGYLACLAHTDFMLGTVLDELDRLDLWKTTIVVFTADHGMHVGEKGIWGKWTLFDEATRVPLVIATPKGMRGARITEVVELIDVFPTLVDLTDTTQEFRRPCVELAPRSTAGEEVNQDQVVYNVPRGGPRAPVPGEGPVRNSEGHIFRHVYCDPLDGTSLSPFLFAVGGEGEGGGGAASRPPFALSQKMTCKMPPKRGTSPFLDLDPNTPTWIDFCPNKHVPRNPPYGAMGYVLRTRLWKYVAWLRWDTHSFLPSLDRAPLAEQLYYINGPRPGDGELLNLAGVASHSNTHRRLRRLLFDFLFFNASFAHLYHRRLDDRSKNRVIISGRDTAGCPRDHYIRHFYDDVSE